MLGLLKENNIVNKKALNTWFDSLPLPVAPSCNMMCNFCTKDSDCICNGNSPEVLSKSMTPRQAVNWAITSANKNRRIKVIKIAGPGEPLCNLQTFEVLRRLSYELPDHIVSISTNGLLLAEKAQELYGLNVKMVEVSMNGFFEDTILKLCSRIIKDRNIVVNSTQLPSMLLKGQLEGIKRCLKEGILVKVNTIYFPGVNDDDILEIALKCRELGVRTLSMMPCYPGGKLRNLRVPTLQEMVSMQQKALKYVDEVEIRNFTTS